MQITTTLPIEVRTPESSTEHPASSSCLDFIASDSTLDRYCESISAAGWKLDNYRRNPVFQNSHQYGDILFTLGKALITEVRDGLGRGAPTAPVLFQRIQFACDINPMAKIAYGLYKGGFLHGVSVGFIPLKWEDPPSDRSAGSQPAVSQAASLQASERSGAALDEVPTIHSERSTPTSGPRRRYLEQELLEVSAVAIPANPNALALAYKSGAVEKSDLKELNDLLRCTLSSTLSPEPAAPKEHLKFFLRTLHAVLRKS